MTDNKRMRVEAGDEEEGNYIAEGEETWGRGRGTGEK